GLLSNPGSEHWGNPVSPMSPLVGFHSRRVGRADPSAFHRDSGVILSGAQGMRCRGGGWTKEDAVAAAGGRQSRHGYVAGFDSRSPPAHSLAPEAPHNFSNPD